MAEDVVTVETSIVACEGEGPTVGHPRVFLTFAPGARRIVCPYCGRVFVPAGDAEPTAA